jgi:hypothetical protein
MTQGNNGANNPVKSLPKRPTFDFNDVSERLRSYDRTPFLDLLALWMECVPTTEEIADFARKKPDLWVKAMTDLARIGGYTEKQEVLHTVNVNQMSDSQLEDHARQLAQQFGLEFDPRLLTAPQAAQPIPSKNPMAKAFDGEIIDVTPADVPDAPVRKKRKRSPS